MRRGPAPKPTALKLLCGNAGRRPVNHHEPKPKRAKHLRTPTELDEHGKKFWKRYAPKLKTLGLLSEIDLDLLSMGAQWWSVHVRALNEVRDSIVQESDANGKVARPEIQIAKTAAS